jgi:2-polyprenyl-6-methoxyphenol hydroxylase-like FAD-dependent oxidoreductase
MLREVVAELPGCTLATGWRVAALRQDAGGAAVTVEDSAGHQAVLEAGYVLGCDGSRSTVREQIGARYVGEHALRPNFGMLPGVGMRRRPTPGRSSTRSGGPRRADDLRTPLGGDLLWAV